METRIGLTRQHMHAARIAKARVRRVAAGGGLEEVEVTIGLADEARVEIVSGLAEGDRVRVP